MSNTQVKFEHFRHLHESPGAFVIPNPWDAGSARILTGLGFQALATTSAGLAVSLGRQDGVGLVSRDQVLANAAAIVQATHLPVSGDLESCYSAHPEGCGETIRLASAAGLVGGSIEDTTGDTASPIREMSEAVERVAAAAEAARKLPFLLTARAENFLWGRPDLDDTIRRLQAYSAAGAHVLYAPCLPSLDAIHAVCCAVDKPVNVVMGLRGPAWSVAELAAAGVRRISVGGSLARFAITALVRAASEMRDFGTFTYAADNMSHSEVSACMMSAETQV
ncbi:MAG: isocitrate lyase/phosphoenolpyruvate mutase family protein [Acidobacteriia bacterium]|nr:isocitrate lyase/phosphoenolpyruvate mutase family protein [Terriglobia bacterium]